MTIWKEYLLANSLKQAFQYLESSNHMTCWVAGGTDLMLEVQQGRHTLVDRMVDLNTIPQLGVLEVQGDDLLIGAGVPVSRIATSEIVKEHARAVSEATRLIGGPQVRNVATLGGNVAHALPAADGMISLVAMDAIAIIAQQEGIEEQPILNLFKGPGISSLTKNQIILQFRIKQREKGEGSAFQRIMRPQGVALPILNLAVWVKREDDMVLDIRVAFGPSGPVPSRATSVEETLRGKHLTPAGMDAALAAIATTVNFRTSKNRATAEYRHQIARQLFMKTFSSAWERAGS